MRGSEAKFKKVLFLHQGGELYGSDLIFLQVVKALSSSVEPLVVLDNRGPLEEELKKITKHISTVNLGVLRRKYFNVFGILTRIYFIVRSTLWLMKYIKHENVSLVYSNTIGVLAGACASKSTGVPHIWHLHEILTKPKFIALLLPFFAIRLSQKVISNSKAVSRYLLRCMHSPKQRNKIDVVYNAIDTKPFDKVVGDKIREEFSIKRDTLLISTIGRIHYRKGQDYFLDVAHVIKKSGFTDFKILIVGDVFSGYERLMDRLKMKMRKLGLDENLTFCGFRNDVPEIVKASDIIVVPSTLPESFGLSILEAMAAQRPVVATAHGGPLEIVVDGETGYLVPKDDPEVMAKRLLQLAGDKSLRERMGKCGRMRLDTQFSYNHFSHDIRTIVLSMLR